MYSLASETRSSTPSPDLECGLSRLYDDLIASPGGDVSASPDSLRRSLLEKIDSEPARVWTDENGLITATNPAFSRLCGFSFSEIRGRKPGSFLHGPLTEPDVVDQIRQGLAAREEMSVQITNYHKDGSTYRVQILIRPCHADGRFVGFSAEERKIG